MLATAVHARSASPSMTMPPAPRLHSVPDVAAEASLPAGSWVDIDSMLKADLPRKRVRRGERLYAAGEPFRNIYIVRVGVLKSFSVTEDGTSQVTRFSLARDVIGFDGIESGRHESTVVALEDSEICIVPFDQCEERTSYCRETQQLLFRILGREIARGHDQMLLLGTMRAEQKLASFLIDLSERYGRLGYSRTSFVLRMTREDIGSYVGLKLETVSRLLSRFQNEGLIKVQGRSIVLLDVAALRDLIQSLPGSSPRTSELRRVA